MFQYLGLRGECQEAYYNLGRAFHQLGKVSLRLKVRINWWNSEQHQSGKVVPRSYHEWPQFFSRGTFDASLSFISGLLQFALHYYNKALAFPLYEASKSPGHTSVEVRLLYYSFNM